MLNGSKNYDDYYRDYTGNITTATDNTTLQNSHTSQVLGRKITAVLGGDSTLSDSTVVVLDDNIALHFAVQKVVALASARQHPFN